MQMWMRKKASMRLKSQVYILSKNLKKQKLASQEDVNVNSGESKVYSDDDESSTLRDYSNTVNVSYVDESEHYSYGTREQHDKHNTYMNVECGTCLLVGFYCFKKIPDSFLLIEYN